MAINTKAYIEKYLKIVDKDNQLIYFKMKPAQVKLYNKIAELWKQNKPIRIIILKARQIGYSTLIEGIGFKQTVTTPNYRFGIITHKEDATTNLYNMSKRFYIHLPDELKPQEKQNNARKLIFDTKDGKGLNSSIECMTAGASGVGRSSTFKCLHGSEVAFWEGDVEETITGLFQSVPTTAGSMIILESTANGMNHFYDLWVKAVENEKNGIDGFIPFFSPWFDDTEYIMEYKGFELTDEEIVLKQTYGLSNEQLAWRRWKLNSDFNGDLLRFRQEYPSCWEEAFVTSGDNYFDKDIIVNRINEIRFVAPLKRGNFEAKFNENKTEILDYEWIESANGYIQIYEEPISRNPYVLAGDPAGEGEDYYTGQVMNNITSRQVAVLKMLLDEDIYAEQLYCLGLYYNKALLGIETNITKYSTILLGNWNYPNLYVRDREDTYTGTKQRVFGFKTTKVTKPVILAEFKTLFREDPTIIRDIETLNEMLTFIKDERGGGKAIRSKHDDLVMAWAIACYIRKDQEFTLLPKETETKLTQKQLITLHALGYTTGKSKIGDYLPWEN